MPLPPYAIDQDALFVAFLASAEFSCHLALGWPLPVNVLDLYAEFRNMTNGLPPICGSGLLGALTWFGLSGIQAVAKDAMRDLALRGGPWTDEERVALLDYCDSDVSALARLLPVMAPGIDMPRALLRGRYMEAVAQIEHNGVPIDTVTLARLLAQWGNIQDRLIAEIDADYGVYQGRTFKMDLFAAYLARHNIPWPLTMTGRLDLQDNTFKDMAKAHPELRLLKELRATLSRMRALKLEVGQDGRNRCLLSPFGSKTGRNQPSNAKFIFGPAKWLRGLIKPQRGCGLAYIDWSQQEFGIAAALSRDTHMMQAYLSGDPYLEFAKQARAVPADASKDSHGAAREQFKACALAVLYGMGAEKMAAQIRVPESRAKELLDVHRYTYRTFWRWSDAALDHAMLHLRLWTTFGWMIHTGVDPNPRSLRNFPMQANGAEMLRIALILAVEHGIRVCAPVHDAILIEAPLEGLDNAVETMQRLMAEASAIVLDGFNLRSEAKLIRYPERYMDDRGAGMWSKVMRLLDEVNAGDSEPTCA